MNYKSIIEAILYTVGSKGIELSELKRILNINTLEIKTNLKQMSKQFSEDENCGLCIKVYGEKYYLLTKENNHSYLEKLIVSKAKNPLTPSLLETIAIIAYNQPCPKSKIEEIRNIDATFAINRLIELNLIENIGKSNAPGNPYLYQVTQNFFNLFGIKSINQLPPIENINFEDNEINFFDSSR